MSSWVWWLWQLIEPGGFFDLGSRTSLQTHATPQIVGLTMLGVVVSVLAVVSKWMQQLPAMLVPAMQRGKDAAHKSLETMCNARAWPQQCWRSYANGSNTDALRFGDHGTNERLGVVDRFQTLRNNSQEHAKHAGGVQTDATCNIQQCWELLNDNVPSVCKGLYTLHFSYNKYMLRKVPVLVGRWCACSAVLRTKRVKTNMPEIVVFTVPSTCLYTVVPRYNEPLVISRFHCITP